jgi:hypothetical protein
MDNGEFVDLPVGESPESKNMWEQGLKASGGIFKNVGGSGINGIKKIGSGIGGVAEGGLRGGLGAIKSIGSISGKAIGGIGTIAGKGLEAVADNQLVKGFGGAAGKGFGAVTDNALAKGIGSVAGKGFGALRGGLALLGLQKDIKGEDGEDTEEQIEMQETYTRCKREV